MPAHDWWIPCSQIAGFKLNQPPPNWVEFERQFVLVEHDDNDRFCSVKEYEASDGTCTITIDHEGIAAASFSDHFFVAGTNIIGLATDEALSIIAAKFDLNAKSPRFDTWVEVAPNVLQRFIDFDELCLFLTENEKRVIIAADVFG